MRRWAFFLMWSFSVVLSLKVFSQYKHCRLTGGQTITVSLDWRLSGRFGPFMIESGQSWIIGQCVNILKSHIKLNVVRLLSWSSVCSLTCPVCSAESPETVCSRRCCPAVRCWRNVLGPCGSAETTWKQRGGSWATHRYQTSGFSVFMEFVNS